MRGNFCAQLRFFLFVCVGLNILVSQGMDKKDVLMGILNKHCRMYALVMAYSSSSDRSSAERVVDACRTSTAAVSTV